MFSAVQRRLVALMTRHGKDYPDEAAGKKVKDDLKASDLFTNEFVDTKIKL